MFQRWMRNSVKTDEAYSKCCQVYFAQSILKLKNSSPESIISTVSRATALKKVQWRFTLWQNFWFQIPIISSRLLYVSWRLYILGWSFFSSHVNGSWCDAKQFTVTNVCNNLFFWLDPAFQSQFKTFFVRPCTPRKWSVYPHNSFLNYRQTYFLPYTMSPEFMQIPFRRKKGRLCNTKISTVCRAVNIHYRRWS